MSVRRKWFLAAASAALAAIAAAVPFRADLRAARDGLEGRSVTIQTAAAQMEYAIAGSGSVLIVAMAAPWRCRRRAYSRQSSLLMSVPKRCPNTGISRFQAFSCRVTSRSSLRLSAR